MCGIFACIGKRDDAPNIVFDGIKLLEYRGYDSWGVSYIPEIKSNKILTEKHTGKIGASVLRPTSKSNIALGHTRWATHGGVTNNNAHPHLDCHSQIAVIHNGIVENYQELKQKLLIHNHSFKSETDTEVISHLIEEKLETMNIRDAVTDTFKSLVGSNAICVLDLKSKTITACRNGSPIVVGSDELTKQFFLASDVPAFLKFTNKVHFLNDGEGAVLSKNGIQIFDIENNSNKKLVLQTLDWKMKDAEKGGFDHFLLKEISEQPKTILKTALINKEKIEKLAKLIKESKKTILIGCGTASYCALAGKYLFADIGRSVENYGAYEFMPFANSCDKDTLVIGISQSGETADTLLALKEAKKHGAKITALINARGSTMERLVEIALPIGAGPEIAVVSTKALTSQLSTLYLVTKAVENKYEEGKSQIKVLSATLASWLNDKLLNNIINLAKEINKSEHMYVIGKYLNYPAAMEFGLKIKETSYIHAESFSAGELKHGVITLIQKDTPCFVLASNDETKNEVLSSAAEIMARGGKTIGIAPFNSPEFIHSIQTPDLGKLTIFGNIITGQLLGYYLGLGRGADPDKPRNLAKSVTVK
jgi:glutamine---fructose-6-phosphate transaminase (isomerizing)